jgi:hypothetical protein
MVVSILVLFVLALLLLGLFGLAPDPFGSCQRGQVC